MIRTCRYHSILKLVLKNWSKIRKFDVKHLLRDHRTQGSCKQENEVRNRKRLSSSLKYRGNFCQRVKRLNNCLLCVYWTFACERIENSLRYDGDTKCCNVRDCCRYCRWNWDQKLFCTRFSLMRASNSFESCLRLAKC